jgi:type VI secretion system protein ImpH
MATQGGIQTADLKFAPLREILEQDPNSVHFFQAVRLLGRLYPERNPVGLFVSPSSEVVRFSSVPSLSFPASEIQEFAVADNGQPALAVNFMGLCASVGVLPSVYVEFLLERAREKDPGPADFFDLFNHRMISLFYRGWQKHHFYIAFERTGTGDDLITQKLLDLIGLGVEPLRHRMEIDDEACLYYSGLLSQRRPTAQGLKQLLEDYFDVPVSVQQFTGMWRRLPLNNRTFLLGSDTFNERLGIGTIVGDEAFDQHGTVTVRIGPLSFARYQEFLPGAPASIALGSWLRFYTNREFDFVIRLVLHRDEVPSMALGDDQTGAPSLGLVSWIRNRPLERDPDEATYLLS